MPQDEADWNFERPPTPPPLPRPQASVASSNPPEIKMSSRMSPLIQMLQAARCRQQSESGAQAVEAECTGWYFFYGTLMDSTFLADVLSLTEPPVMRPAKVVGYALKLWGQYPALVDGKPDQEIVGMSWEVKDKKHAVRLQEYETRNYRPATCTIFFADKLEGEHNVQGYLFKFVGNELELREGGFDLEVWLKSMKRRPCEKSS